MCGVVFVYICAVRCYHDDLGGRDETTSSEHGTTSAAGSARAPAEFFSGEGGGTRYDTARECDKDNIYCEAYAV